MSQRDCSITRERTSLCAVTWIAWSFPMDRTIERKSMVLNFRLSNDSLTLVMAMRRL